MQRLQQQVTEADMAAKVEIYTTMFCPFCARAKHLLDRKAIQYVEYDVSSDPEARRRMRERSDGRYTVPQIFIDERGIGGSDELAALEAGGRLDGLLGAAA